MCKEGGVGVILASWGHVYEEGFTRLQVKSYNYFRIQEGIIQPVYTGNKLHKAYILNLSRFPRSF